MDRTLTFLRPRGYLCTAGAYVIQKPGNQCTPDTILGTLAECESARASLDSSAPAVIGESSAFTPKGCSRFKGEWYFNTHPTGRGDDKSELACKGKETPPERPTAAPERPAPERPAPERPTGRSIRVGDMPDQAQTRKSHTTTHTQPKHRDAIN